MLRLKLEKPSADGRYPGRSGASNLLNLMVGVGQRSPLTVLLGIARGPVVSAANPLQPSTRDKRLSPPFDRSVSRLRELQRMLTRLADGGRNASEALLVSVGNAELTYQTAREDDPLEITRETRDAKAALGTARAFQHQAQSVAERIARSRDELLTFLDTDVLVAAWRERLFHALMGDPEPHSSASDYSPRSTFDRWLWRRPFEEPHATGELRDRLIRLKSGLEAIGEEQLAALVPLEPIEDPDSRSWLYGLLYGVWDIEYFESLVQRARRAFPSALIALDAQLDILITARRNVDQLPIPTVREFDRALSDFALEALLLFGVDYALTRDKALALLDELIEEMRSRGARSRGRTQ